MSPTSERSLPVPDLGDDRIRLRAWSPADAPALAAAWAEPDISRWTAVPGGAGAAGVGADRAARWIAGEAERRRAGVALDLVVSPADGDAVWGEVGLAPIDWARRTAEIGFWIAPEVRGRGHARRAVGLLTGWALDHLALDRLVALVDPANVAAARAAGGAGLQPRGHLADGRGLWASIVDRP